MWMDYPSRETCLIISSVYHRKQNKRKKITFNNEKNVNKTLYERLVCVMEPRRMNI